MSQWSCFCSVPVQCAVATFPGPKHSHILISNRRSQIACLKKRRGGRSDSAFFVDCVLESSCLWCECLRIHFFLCILTRYGKGACQSRLHESLGGGCLSNIFNIAHTTKNLLGTSAFQEETFFNAFTVISIEEIILIHVYCAVTCLKEIPEFPRKSWIAMEGLDRFK